MFLFEKTRDEFLFHKVAIPNGILPTFVAKVKNSLIQQRMSAFACSYVPSCLPDKFECLHKPRGNTSYPTTSRLDWPLKLCSYRRPIRLRCQGNSGPMSSYSIFSYSFLLFLLPAASLAVGSTTQFTNNHHREWNNNLHLEEPTGYCSQLNST